MLKISVFIICFIVLACGYGFAYDNNYNFNYVDDGTTYIPPRVVETTTIQQPAPEPQTMEKSVTPEVPANQVAIPNPKPPVAQPQVYGTTAAGQVANEPVPVVQRPGFSAPVEAIQMPAANRISVTRESTGNYISTTKSTATATNGVWTIKRDYIPPARR